MRAVVHDRYGGPSVLQLRELDRPVAGPDEVLVRTHSAAIHPGDWLLMTGRPLLFRPAFGFRRPRKRIPGFDIAGTVEEVGSTVKRFAPGDLVFGEAPNGSCAEYVSVPEDKLAIQPGNLTPMEAAVVPVSGSAALVGLRDAGRVVPGQHVLIIGASGGIGTFGVQVAKALGAEVTGVCSTTNVDLVRSLGADHVIDYTQEDFTKGGPRYDLILDNVANHSLADCRRALTPDGVLFTNNGTSGNRWIGPLGRMAAASALSLVMSKQGRPFYAPVRRQDLLDLTELIEKGQVKPVIGSTYPLAETADAMAEVGGGHARGKIAITVGAA